MLWRPRIKHLPRGAEMYSLLLETYIKDSAEKHRLFHAVETVPAVRRKAQWALKWVGRCAHNYLTPRALQGPCLSPLARRLWKLGTVRLIREDVSRFCILALPH